jgi:uncharacterized protein YbjQ (UPF0145 family)
MLYTTTDSVQGREIAEYLGVVTGQAIYGANVISDFFAGVRDIVGGRAGAYESVLRDGAEQAMADMTQHAEDMGANAILGISIDYEAVGKDTSMLMVAVTGTAVRLA